MLCNNVLLFTAIIFACLLLVFFARCFNARRKRSLHRFFKDESFAFEFLRTLGASMYGAADIGECLVAADHIKDGNFESWYTEWRSLADQVHRIAAECYNNGHFQSAQAAYLRACSYYRTADFYLHGNRHDPRINEVSRASRDCFAKAVELSSTLIEPIKIPYENTNLPGYFYHADTRDKSTDKKSHPTLIIHTGFDGTQEELYVYALEGVKKGYHVVTFEGPGQGAVIREQNLPFRADWENVVTPVIDYLTTRQEVDSTMIMLYGLSYGGYLAPRAACFDKRIKILIANGGIFDPLRGVLKNIKVFRNRDELLAFIQKHPVLFDTFAYRVMRFKTTARWFFEHGMFSFNTKTPSELLIKLAEWSLDGHAQKITSHTLICDVDNEMKELSGQARLLYDQLVCPKEFVTFKSEDGAGYHCQMGALSKSNQVIFDWIDTQVKTSVKE